MIVAVMLVLLLSSTPLVLAQQEQDLVEEGDYAAPIPWDLSGSHAAFLQYDDPTSLPSFYYCGIVVTPLNDHSPGEFTVSYSSGEAMWAAPQENVVHTITNEDVPFVTPLYLQILRFEDIASIPDPYERLAAEEAKFQEILA